MSDIQRVIDSSLFDKRAPLKLVVICALICLSLCCAACGSDFDMLLQSDGASDDDSKPVDPLDPDDPHNPNAQGPSVLFWAEDDTSVYSIPADKSDSKRKLTAASAVPYDIMIDAAEGYVYWSFMGGTRGYIYSLPLTKGDATSTELLNTNKNNITAMYFEPLSKTAFWSKHKQANSSNGIFKSPLPALSETAINTNVGSNTYTNAICMDASIKRLFLCVNQSYGAGLGSGKGGQIVIVNSDDGTSSTQLYDEAGSDGEPAFSGIAFDKQQNIVYFAHNRSPGDDDVIYKTASDAWSPESWLVAGGFGIDKLSIANKEQMIYWSDRNAKRIYRAPLSDPDDVEVFLQLDHSPSAMVIAP